MQKLTQRAVRASVADAPQGAGEQPVLTEAAAFLNIDLDVRSRRSLAPLVQAWPWAYRPQAANAAPHARWLILNARGPAKNPAKALSAESVAKHLLQHIEALRGEARRCWNGAHRRMFDIGVRAGGTGRAFEGVRLTAGTLKRIAAAGAHVQLTVYAAECRRTLCRAVEREGQHA